MDKPIKTVKCTPKVMKQCVWSYRYNSGTDAYCDYLSKVGHSRGCSPDRCDKFKQRSEAMK